MKFFQHPKTATRAFLLFFCSIWCLTFPLKIHSQSYPVRHYTEANGIINSTVYKAAQDSIGQMWFATRGGVSMYDGTYWKNYTVSDGLSSQNIAKIYIDKKGKIWALQERHPVIISLLEGDKWERKFFYPDLSIYSLYHSFIINYDDNDNIRIFVGTDNDGLICYTDGKWKKYGENSALGSDNIIDIAFRNDSLFIVTPNGLSLLHKNIITSGLEKKYNLPDDKITGLYCGGNANNDEILITGMDWFGKIEGGNYIPLANRLDFTHNLRSPSMQILPYKDFGYYLATMYAVYFYDLREKQLTAINSDNGLITNGATHMFLDRENNLWICSYRGINKISSRLFTIFRKIDGLYENEVTSLAEIEKGRYILGYNGAIGFYDGERFDHIELNNFKEVSKFHSRVQDICMEKNGTFWIAASWQGLYKINARNREEISRIEMDTVININSVMVKDDGKVLFSAQNQLFTISEEKPVVYKSPEGIAVRKLFKDMNGTIYLGCMHKGLFYETHQGWINVSGDPEKYSNNVYAFYHDSRNRKLVGMIDGLFVIENDSLVRFNPGGQIIKNPVYLIFEDEKKRLWLGSDNGIYRWDGKNLSHFNIQNGLAGQEVNRDAGIVDSDGHIWIGTNNGLSLYREEFAHDTNKLPKPLARFSHLTTDNDTFDLLQENTLSYNQNNLHFQFKALTFIDEEDINVKYRLQGFDDEYSSARPTYYKIISYNNLDPGVYRFHLKVQNALGVWSDEISSGLIKIRSPFFKTWWFLLIILLIIGAFGFWVFSYITQKQYSMKLSREVILRTRQLKESQRELQKTNKSREKLYAIIAHDLRAPFNSMLGLTEMLHKKPVDIPPERKESMIKSLYQTANKSYFLLENLLTWARSQRGDLQFKPADMNLSAHLEDILHLMAGVAQSKNIRLINHIDSRCTVYADYNMIRTVIRNLLSNAIKFTRPGGRIIIYNLVQDNEMRICVKDNGVGMTEEQLKSLFSFEVTSSKGTSSEGGTGLGLLLCKEFIEKHGGQIHVNSKLHEGSEFCFTLPHKAKDKKIPSNG